ncbi:MAG: hypothetical protein EA425_15320 [Puniceicoccaceae bacterium]|nr:MAG: hypothetical protein EA425_15320 [Puniceicoccaceae bacterium]
MEAGLVVGLDGEKGELVGERAGEAEAGEAAAGVEITRAVGLELTGQVFESEGELVGALVEAEGGADTDTGGFLGITLDGLDDAGERAGAGVLVEELGLGQRSGEPEGTKGGKGFQVHGKGGKDCQA